MEGSFEQSYQQGSLVNRFLPFLTSIKSFKEEYIKINFEADKNRILYLEALIAIDTSIQLGDIAKLKTLSKLIGYLNEIENKNELKEFYDDNDNPIKESSLIILACKYNKIDILEYLFDDRNKIVVNLTTSIGRIAIHPHDKDENGHNVFYYAIREDNIAILDILMNRWPDTYFSSPVHSQELYELLSRAYEELKLKNVLLSGEMEIFVENKLINRRFIVDVSSAEVNQNIQTSYNTVQKRIDLVLENMQLLQTEYLNANEVNDKFIFIARFIAQNIHVLKKQLKSTYAKLPWEEIEFCIVSFISSHIKCQEINLIYNSVLTKDRLLSHLRHFAEKLNEEKACIKDSNINSKLPKLKREKIIMNVISKHPSFKELYDDHEHIRSVYSLEKIVKYINLASSANPQEQEGQYVIQRALQITGECLKNTLESPNLSNDICEILLSSGLQKDTIVILKSLRNFLSHSFSLSNRVHLEKTKDFNFFNNIQNDLGKINIEISDILHQNMLKAMRLLLKNIIDSKDLEETKKRIAVFKNVELDRVQLESFKITEHEKIVKLIKKLKDQIKDKTDYEKSLFQKIDDIIYSANCQLDPMCDYKSGFMMLKFLYNFGEFNKQIDNDCKLFFNRILESFIPKFDFQMIPRLSIQIYSNFKQRTLNNAKDQMKILDNINLTLDNDREMTLLIYKICMLADFESGKICSLEDLKKRLCTNQQENESTNAEKEVKNIKVKGYLNERLNTLEIILSSKELITSKLIAQFPSYKRNIKLQLAMEMLVVDIIGALQNRLGNNQLLFDTYSPLLIGKALRNHLAHGNTLVDVLPYDTSIAIISNAIKLVDEKKKLIASNDILIGQPILDDVYELNNHYSHNLSMIISQIGMFDALRTGNFKQVQYYFTKGVDIKARDINNRTLLHFAIIGGNLEIIKFLLNCDLDFNAEDINGQNSLLLAVSLGNNKILKLITEKGANINNYRNAQNKTLLHISAQNGYLDIVEYLLKNKADTRFKDIYGCAPLHYAVQNNHKDVVKVLLNKENNIDVNECAGGHTSLYLAAEHGHIEIVDFLINNKANINVSTDLNFSPLHVAALNGHLDVVNTLILNGAYVNANNLEGCMPLHSALLNGHEKIVNILLQHGANVNASTIKGMTLLHFAAEYNRLEIVGILIENKANVNAKSFEGTTPLHLAARNANEKIVELLIRKGANVNVRSCESMTPLHFAAQNINPEVINVLISNGANINSKLTNNDTPLHAAALGDNKEVVEALIDQGAYVNAAGQNNCTPLHYATANSNKHCVKVLIENGADVNAKDVDNCTPLHVAALSGCAELVEFLIINKANVNSKSKHDSIPLHLAAQEGHKAVVEILVLNGANINAKTKDGFTPLDSAFLNKEIIKILIANKAHVKATCHRSILFAAFMGHKDILNVFLKNKVDINMKYGDESVTLLHLAARNGKNKVVKLLMENGANVNAVASENLTPLHFAAFKGHGEVVSMLIAAGAKIDTKSNDGTAPLHCAATGGYSNVVKVLLNNGVNINIRDSKNRTPAELAVAYNHLEVIRKLLQNKDVDINAKGNDNFTLLHIAAQEGNLEITKYLVDQKADINAENTYGSKPIHIAAREGNRNIVEFFLNNGFKINDLGGTQSTLLHYAAVQGQLEITKYLIEQHIDLNAKNVMGSTPVHIAVKTGYNDVVEVLLNNGAMYNPVDIFNRKPFQYATNENIINALALTNNLFEAVKCNDHLRIQGLIKRGAFVNAKNISDVTPLHYCAWKGYQQSIDALLQNKANPNAIGKNGWTPLHYATKFNHLDIVKVLLANGAVYNAMDDAGKIPLAFATHQGIVNLLKLISDSFRNVEKGKSKIFDDLKTVKDTGTIKAIMNAQNRENRTLIVAAIHSNFAKIDQLKEIAQDNVSTEIKIAIALLVQERCEESLKIFEKVLKKRIEILGHDNPGTLDIQIHIGKVFYKQKYYQKALNIFKEIYEKQKHMLGLNNTYTLSTKNMIALVLHRQGNNEEALRIYREVCQKQKEILGPNNVEYLVSQQHMALVLENEKQYDEALSINRKIYPKLKSILGSTNPATLSVQNNMALVLSRQGKHKKALETYEKVYEKRKIVLGPNHSDTLRTLHNMAVIQALQGNHADQLKCYEKVFNTQKVALGPGHLDTLSTQCNIANLLFRQGKYIEALKYYKESLDRRKAILGPNHPDILITIKQMEVIDSALKIKGYDSGTLEKEININSAISNGDIDIVETLLQNGRDVNNTDGDGRTPLHYATNNGLIEIVKVLLKHNADATKASKKGNTPLHTATLKNCKEIIVALLQHVKKINPNASSIFVNAKTTAGGTTSLHIAAQNNNKEIVMILLKDGAHYDAKNTQGKTPEDVANGDSKNLLNTINRSFKAVSNSEKCNLDALLEEKDCNTLGAILCARNTDRKTLLQVANAHKQRNIAELIIKKLKFVQTCEK